MRRYLLLTLSLFVSTLCFAQTAYEDCAGALGDVFFDLDGSSPFTLPITPFSGDEGDYTPGSMGNGTETTFFAFTVPALASGNYQITIADDIAVPGPAGEFSVGLSMNDCSEFGNADMAEISYTMDIEDASQPAPCAYLVGGATYVLVIAQESGYMGDIVLTISGPDLDTPSNNECHLVQLH